MYVYLGDIPLVSIWPETIGEDELSGITGIPLLDTYPSSPIF